MGEHCVIGRNVYIDAGVVIGANCKVQNHALIYAPAQLADGVFVGPAAVLANDTYPRAINPDGRLKSEADWDKAGVEVGHGASIGARAVVLGGNTIGEWALVAAGAVVNSDVPARALVVGVPARVVGWVGADGRRLEVGDGQLVDASTGDRFRETPEGLVPV